jgi:hypothetical protein
MNNLELKSYIAAMLQRELDDLVYDGVDVLQNAINDALARAQRLLDFKLSLERGYLPLVSGKANWRSDMLDGVGGSPVLVKKIKSLYTDDSYEREIRLLRESDAARLHGAGGHYAFMTGSTVYVKNQDEVSDGFYSVYYSLLAPLSADTDTNYLTENISDWIVFQSYFQLQFFLKEDERAMQTAGILGDKWNSVQAWNASMYDETDISLD